MTTSPACVAAIRDLLRIQMPFGGGGEDDDATEEINNKIEQLSMQDPPLHHRLDLFVSGAVNLCMEIVRAPPGTHPDRIIETSWWIINGAMSISDANNPTQRLSVDMGVKHGLIELATEELRFRPLRAHGRFMMLAFICLTCPAMDPVHANRLLASGAPAGCVELMCVGDLSNENAMDCLDLAIRTLALLTMSRPHVMRASLENILVARVVPMLEMLRLQNNYDQALVGFNAARLLIRLLEGDVGELFSPVDIFHFMNFYRGLMEIVLQAGPENGFSFNNTSWSLAGMAFDVMLLSRSLKMVPHLSNLVIHVVEMASLYGARDERLLGYCLVFFGQIGKTVGGQMMMLALRDDVRKSMAVARSSHNPGLVENLAVMKDLCEWLALNEPRGQ